MKYMNMDDVFFISHVDADGYMSMANMLDAVVGVENIQDFDQYDDILSIQWSDYCLNINYPLNFPIEKVPEGKIVFITDTSFTENTIDALYAIAKKSKLVVWTDHHKTSLWFLDKTKDYEDSYNIIPILYDGMSSSMTTHYMNKFFKLYIQNRINEGKIKAEDALDNTIDWEVEVYKAFRKFSIDLYTSPDMDPRKVTEKELNKYREFCKKYNLTIRECYNDIEPYNFIKYIDDYDIWKHEYGNDTMYMHYGLEQEDPSIYYTLLYEYIFERDHPDDFDALFDDFNHQTAMNRIMDAGITIKNNKDKQNKELSEKETFVRKFFYNEEHGMVDVLCCNSRGNSFVFDKKYTDYTFCMLYHYDGKEWKYSIYCPPKYLEQGFDASIIAKDFGGGGHAGASGFSTTELIKELM